MPKDEDEPDSLTTAEGAWAPLFLSQKKQRKSDMDPIMEIYAEMAGISAPEPVHAKLTAEYINKHLCGHKSCPGAIMFQQYGLGPLAESSCLGTISSIKNVKPQGIYGMSQAYGTMDSYGAYGFFVKKKEKKMKAPCESPDCPYTNSAVQESAPNRTISSTKKCQCNNCSKYPKFTKCNSCCNQNCF